MRPNPRTGGAAFPLRIPTATQNGAVIAADINEGMSLRDYFAGQAIAGMLANPDLSASAARLKVATDEFRVDVSLTAFEIADAMLAERNK